MKLKYFIFLLSWCFQLIKSIEHAVRRQQNVRDRIIRRNLLNPTDFRPMIVGGSVVKNMHPYHAAFGPICGAAIIDKKWAITVAHCRLHRYITVGSIYRNVGKKYAIKNYHIHPEWYYRQKFHEIDYDFALLELREPLMLSDSVQPIKVGRPEDLVIGKLLTVTGWGSTVQGGPVSHVLRSVHVPIVHPHDCQKVPFPYFNGTLTPRMLCAGYRKGKKDACQGDSGGPAVSGDRLIGLVSFGYGCATPNSYGVYSNVASVRGWIQKTTNLTLI